MKYVGVDLHKKTISVCVVVVVRGQRKVADRRRFACSDTAGMQTWFASLDRYRVVVEATAAYEWFVALVEATAERVVLAHPQRLRIIAESKRKSDKLDAQVLAEELAQDAIPESWRPTPRVAQVARNHPFEHILRLAIFPGRGNGNVFLKGGWQGCQPKVACMRRWRSARSRCWFVVSWNRAAASTL